MTRLNLLFLTLCALIGAAITYWLSYPVIEWLSTLASHELILVVIVVCITATLITLIYDSYKIEKSIDKYQPRNRRSTDQKIYLGELDEMYFSTKERLDKD